LDHFQAFFSNLLGGGSNYVAPSSFLNDAAGQLSSAANLITQDLTIDSPAGDVNRTSFFISLQAVGEDYGKFAGAAVLAPEPSTLMFFSIGVLGVVGRAWRNKKRLAL
jgi:hypothetical protein